MARLLASMAAVIAAHARDGKHRNAPNHRRMKPDKRRREARRLDHRATERRVLHQQERLNILREKVRKGSLEPVHPRDHHWFAVGLRGGAFTLQPPTGGGASYYARYRAMYEAGVAAREERVAA